MLSIKMLLLANLQRADSQRATRINASRDQSATAFSTSNRLKKPLKILFCLRARLQPCRKSFGCIAASATEVPRSARHTKSPLRQRLGHPVNGFHRNPVKPHTWLSAFPSSRSVWRISCLPPAILNTDISEESLSISRSSRCLRKSFAWRNLRATCLE
jgi:hypothetical protein